MDFPPAGQAEAALEEALPRQFGKYTLLRRLSSGGMAEIYLALHRSMAGFEKLVVIKRILPSMNQNKAFIEMLMHEARIAATLSHPNIVQIFDVGLVDGTYFIAMEHIHGEDIQAIVRAMKRKGLTEFPLEHTLSILLGTCAGLAYAHEKRDLDGRPLAIVHRDISPRNIVVSFTGDVKIVDFGIAKSGVDPGEDTAGGQLKGKAPYMSPEQASGHAIDWRSDIFATGVILFELTTGKRLFKGASEFETLKLIVEKEYPRPSHIRPGYPQVLERIVMRALEKSRLARYQSAREMQADIEAFARNERIPVSQVSLTSWMEGLFEEKLAQQKEALSDMKQLADVIASQQGGWLYESATFTSTDMSTVGIGASLSQVPPPRKRNTPVLVAAGVAAALAAGGVAVLRRASSSQESAATIATASSPREEAAPQRGALDVVATPDGCAIWINGDLRAETTPARIEKLPLGGSIKLKLTKEGFEPHHVEVTLTQAEPNQKIAAELKTGSVTLLLKLEPPTTAVSLDGAPWKGDRARIDGVSAAEEHKLLLSAPGYQSKTITVTAQRGETKTISESLVKDTGGGAAPAGPPGKLRVGAKGGFCNVTVNGRPYGPTPVEVDVRSGPVRVSCKPAGGATMSQVVTVAAGETARVSFKVEP